MADRAISELTPATNVYNTDKFVLEQGGVAKQLTGQVLTNWLTTYAEGHGGIKEIRGPTTIGNVDTYTIVYASTYFDGEPPVEYPYTSTFNVTNGKSITTISEKWAVSSSNTTAPTTWEDTVQTMTEQNRYLWNYDIIHFNDLTTLDTTPVVVGVYGDRGYTWYTYLRYSAVEPTQDSDIGLTPDEWIGLYCGTSSTAPTHYTDYTWYKFKGERGFTGTSITSITGPVTTGNLDVYTIHMSDSTSTTFTVTNGSSISRITESERVGNRRTFTIYLTNGDTSTFTVDDGVSISNITFDHNDSPSGTKGTPGSSDYYRINYDNGTTDSTVLKIYNGANGSGAVSTVAGIPVVGVDGDVPLVVMQNRAPVSGANGDEGFVKQFWYDQGGGVMYTCTSVSGNVYNWRALTTPVDNSLDITSLNPVQNMVITGAINSLVSKGLIIGTVPPTTSTVGSVGQQYFDKIAGILYVCSAINNEVYTWVKAGVTVDSSLSDVSTNPIQNSAVTSKLIPIDTTMSTLHSLTSTEYSYLYETVLGLGNIAVLNYSELI